MEQSTRVFVEPRHLLETLLFTFNVSNMDKKGNEQKVCVMVKWAGGWWGVRPLKQANKSNREQARARSSGNRKGLKTVGKIRSA